MGIDPDLPHCRQILYCLRHQGSLGVEKGELDYTHDGNGASQVAIVIKNLPAYGGDIRDMGSIPGLGKSPGRGHSSSLQ